MSSTPAVDLVIGSIWQHVTRLDPDGRAVRCRILAISDQHPGMMRASVRYEEIGPESDASLSHYVWQDYFFSRWRAVESLPPAPLEESI